MVILLSALISSVSFAANFSAQQIAEFKQLPRAQQEALAKQYGVNLSDLVGASSSSNNKQMLNQQTITPRQFGQNSNNNQLNNQKEEVQEDKQVNPNKPVDFGYDLFAGQPSSYTPVDDLPVPNNYLIAPGDEIDIQLFGSQNKSYELDVTRDGSIQFPQLGPIHVAGQTFSELKNNLTNRIKKQILGVDVSISLGSLRTMQVYVTGDVYRPGAYNIPSLATVTQSLIAAGGFLKSGSLRNIIVRRHNQIIDRLDLYNLLLRGETKHDIRLESGDTVFVGAKGSSVTIEGQVRRPAVYEIIAGETLGTLLKDAGGSKADAYLQQVEVKRYQTDGVHIITVDLSKARGRNLELKDGDRVRFQKVSDQLQDAVIVRGAVSRQGAYAYHSGMKISDLFRSEQDDLMPDTDQNYALVVRETDAEHHIKVLQFNLGKAIRHPDSQQNLVLRDNDQIFVFSNDLNSQDWGEPKHKYEHKYEVTNLDQKVDAQSNQKKLIAATKDDSNTSFVSSKSGQSLSSGQKIDPSTGVQIVHNQQSVSNLFHQMNSISTQAGPDSRQTLLKPLLERLRQQAVNGQSVLIYEITGSVKFPGAYPLVQGATLTDAIQAAGGLLESAAKDQAELTRAIVMPGKVSLKHQRFDLAIILAGKSPDFILESKDRIEIQRKTNWDVDNTVEIQGEVRHPGTYTIGKGENIADLVARAGGLTKYAYPQGAVFSRKVLRLQEKQRMKMMADSLKQEIASLALRRQSSSASYTTSPTDALKVVNDLTTIPAIGRLVISLPKILRGYDHADVMLEDGDKLYIPPKRNSISVMGQVQLASNFTFDPSKTVEQYINMAGGVKKQADSDRIYVIRANGAVFLPNQSSWFMRSSEPLAQGDTIIVPIDTDYLDGLSTFSTATRIMYQIGVAWNAIK